MLDGNYCIIPLRVSNKVVPSRHEDLGDILTGGVLALASVTVRDAERPPDLECEWLNLPGSQYLSHPQ